MEHVPSRNRECVLRRQRAFDTEVPMTPERVRAALAAKAKARSGVS